MLSNLVQHPLREPVSAEIHARPVPTIRGPVSAVYLALMKGRARDNASREHLEAFLAQAGQAPISDGQACCYLRLGDAELRWESHQEFCSYLLILPQASDQSFPGLELPGWWEDLVGTAPGSLINAVRLEMRDGPPPTRPLEALPSQFGTDWIMGSRVVDGSAAVWTDYQQDEEGFTRFLVHNEGMSSFQAGRTCQRLLESDTYRVVALLGFPLARAVWPEVHALDTELGTVTRSISEQAESANDQHLLDELSGLSTRIERLRARTSFRFSATRAYADISLKRLTDLREHRWPGTSSLLKFTERRFLPAIQTCRDADRHLRELSERMGQATALLRTRVELTQQDQNRMLLDAINRRGEVQLRLQQVVEGLSVIAITYYLVGLFAVATERLPFDGWFSIPGSRAAAIGGLAVLVSLYIRRRKKRLIGDET